MSTAHFDWIIVGSGFGGSVSALRLAEKGYRVLVLEKGRRFRKEDFPKTNWDLKNWMWMPQLGMTGIFQMSFFEHVTVVHGVGVGGGSLTYANTLPTPRTPFFKAKSWAHLANWEEELVPHYATAKRMLGAVPYQRITHADEVLRSIARDMGREDEFHPTEVAVFFGNPNKEVKDPYFGGEGPDRTGCTHCGACMTGCRVGAKNTLDRNYLYLAEKRGVVIEPETEVLAVRERTEGGYLIETAGSYGLAKATRRKSYTADNVVFSGGVLGTVPLLLKMQEDNDGLPRLSRRLGDFVRTNSESLIGVISPNAKDDFSDGIAITSILHTDEFSHVEPVRYSKGSGFFRAMTLPHAPAPTLAGRLAGVIRGLAEHPLAWARIATVRDFARQSQILLYMRTLEGTLSMRLGRSAFTGFTRSLVSKLDDPTKAPAAFIPEATEIARKWAEKIKGVTATLFTETILGVPSTAHILGGCCMGKTAEEGVIDPEHRVHGYKGLYVIDGSAVSANPGVNPSLTITALAERAMSFIPAKGAATAKAS